MDAIAGKVIDTLTSLAQDEFLLNRNLKDDIKRMKDTVSAIKAKLQDAEANSSNHQISDWLKKLRDVLYDADDLLDDVFTQTLRKQAMTGNKITKEFKLFFSKSNQIVYSHDVGHEMKEIRKRLDDIDGDKNKLQLSDQPMATSIVDGKGRETHSFVHEDDVIGRDEEKKLVLSYLPDNNVTEEVSVLPIVGIGGLGKTALAQLVYNDKAIKEHFDLRMWVCVSEEFSVIQIATKLLGGTANSILEVVQKEVRDKIGGKKFFLVLDDVWNEDRELWLELKRLLREGAKGSMIVVTTRSKKVARIMRTQEPLFLEGLDDDKSWQLFSRVAFDKGEEPSDSELVTIGKDIVKKCCGVPLAIRTVGSLLYCRNLTKGDWSYFRDIELSKMEDLENKIFDILKLSYDHLGSNLKNCFAYCSLFPKDFEIERETLIQLWIAQGFIPSTNQTRPLEDVGDEYFMNLLSRSFFQDVKKGEYDEIVSCKMHDLMHDLAMQVAENECVAISTGRRGNIGHKFRSLSFDFKLSMDWELPTLLPEQKKLRTFMLPFGAKKENPSSVTQPSKDKSALSSLIQSLKCLRVLVVHHSGLATLPKTIGKLKHLRYLDLSENGALKKLPESITKLHNLQTLKLCGCKGLRELPRGINKLVSLRHLHLDGCDSLSGMPHGLGQLTFFANVDTVCVGSPKEW